MCFMWPKIKIFGHIKQNSLCFKNNWENSGSVIGSGLLLNEIVENEKKMTSHVTQARIGEKDNFASPFLKIFYCKWQKYIKAGISSNVTIFIPWNLIFSRLNMHDIICEAKKKENCFCRCLKAKVFDRSQTNLEKSLKSFEDNFKRNKS